MGGPGLEGGPARTNDFAFVIGGMNCGFHRDYGSFQLVQRQYSMGYPKPSLWDRDSADLERLGYALEAFEAWVVSLLSMGHARITTSFWLGQTEVTVGHGSVMCVKQESRCRMSLDL